MRYTEIKVSRSEWISYIHSYILGLEREVDWNWKGKCVKYGAKLQHVTLIRYISWGSSAKFILSQNHQSLRNRQGTLIKCSRLSHASQTMWRLVPGPMTTSRSAETGSHANRRSNGSRLHLLLPIYFSAEQQTCEVATTPTLTSVLSWPALLSLSSIFLFADCPARTLKSCKFQSNRRKSVIRITLRLTIEIISFRNWNKYKFVIPVIVVAFF